MNKEGSFVRPSLRIGLSHENGFDYSSVIEVCAGVEVKIVFYPPVIPDFHALIPWTTQVKS